MKSEGLQLVTKRADAHIERLARAVVELGRHRQIARFELFA